MLLAVESEIVSNFAGFGFLAAIVLALSFPWVALALDRGTQPAWTAAFTVLATLLFAICHFTMPSKYNIRVDLLIFPPLIVAAWIQSLGFGIASRRRSVTTKGLARGQPIPWGKAALLTFAFLVGLVLFVRGCF